MSDIKIEHIKTELNKLAHIYLTPKSSESKDAIVTLEKELKEAAPKSKKDALHIMIAMLQAKLRRSQEDKTFKQSRKPIINHLLAVQKATGYSRADKDFQEIVAELPQAGQQMMRYAIIYAYTSYWDKDEICHNTFYDGYACQVARELFKAEKTYKIAVLMFTTIAGHSSCDRKSQAISKYYLASEKFKNVSNDGDVPGLGNARDILLCDEFSKNANIFISESVLADNTDLPKFLTEDDLTCLLDVSPKFVLYYAMHYSYWDIALNAIFKMSDLKAVRFAISSESVSCMLRAAAKLSPNKFSKFVRKIIDNRGLLPIVDNIVKMHNINILEKCNDIFSISELEKIKDKHEDLLQLYYVKKLINKEYSTLEDTTGVFNKLTPDGDSLLAKKLTDDHMPLLQFLVQNHDLEIMFNIFKNANSGVRSALARMLLIEHKNGEEVEEIEELTAALSDEDAGLVRDKFACLYNIFRIIDKDIRELRPSIPLIENEFAVACKCIFEKYSDNHNNEISNALKILQERLDGEDQDYIPFCIGIAEIILNVEFDNDQSQADKIKIIAEKVLSLLEGESDLKDQFNKIVRNLSDARTKLSSAEQNKKNTADRYAVGYDIFCGKMLAIMAVRLGVEEEKVALLQDVLGDPKIVAELTQEQFNQLVDSLASLNASADHNRDIVALKYLHTNIFHSGASDDCKKTALNRMKNYIISKTETDGYLSKFIKFMGWKTRMERMITESAYTEAQQELNKLFDLHLSRHLLEDSASSPQLSTASKKSLARNISLDDLLFLLENAKKDVDKKRLSQDIVTHINEENFDKVTFDVLKKVLNHSAEIVSHVENKEWAVKFCRCYFRESNGRYEGLEVSTGMQKLWSGQSAKNLFTVVDAINSVRYKMLLFAAYINANNLKKIDDDLIKKIYEEVISKNFNDFFDAKIEEPDKKSKLSYLLLKNHFKMDALSNDGKKHVINLFRQITKVDSAITIAETMPAELLNKIVINDDENEINAALCLMLFPKENLLDRFIRCLPVNFSAAAINKLWQKLPDKLKQDPDKCNMLLSYFKTKKIIDWVNAKKLADIRIPLIEIQYNNIEFFKNNIKSFISAAASHKDFIAYLKDYMKSDSDQYKFIVKEFYESQGVNKKYYAEFIVQYCSDRKAKNSSSKAVKKFLEHTPEGYQRHAVMNLFAEIDINKDSLPKYLELFKDYKKEVYLGILKSKSTATKTFIASDEGKAFLAEIWEDKDTHAAVKFNIFLKEVTKLNYKEKLKALTPGQQKAFLSWMFIKHGNGYIRNYLLKSFLSLNPGLTSLMRIYTGMAKSEKKKILTKIASDIYLSKVAQQFGCAKGYQTGVTKFIENNFNRSQFNKLYSHIVKLPKSRRSLAMRHFIKAEKACYRKKSNMITYWWNCFARAMKSKFSFGKKITADNNRTKQQDEKADFHKTTSDIITALGSKEEIEAQKSRIESKEFAGKKQKMDALTVALTQAQQQKPPVELPNLAAVLAPTL